MKLLRVHIIAAETCGGLLDDLDVSLRSPLFDNTGFDPLCLVGPNGSGKSQFLQVLAEIFQSIYHACVPTEERDEGNPDTQFEIEYFIPDSNGEIKHVWISRKSSGKRRPILEIKVKGEEDWIELDPGSTLAIDLLPSKIVGYTSGNNETLSLPFLVSRSGYAEQVRTAALADSHEPHEIPDTRLMLIDYGTHLEVLVANLVMGEAEQQHALLQDAGLSDLHSVRCIIQLAHSAAPKVQRAKRTQTNRKGIQLTHELETYLDQLRRCATCYSYDEASETYVFDYWINEQTKLAFRAFWDSALRLYSSLHKLAMLNDLAIPKPTRDRFKRDTKTRRFASRLPEPQDEDKVFRFERVSFVSGKSGEVVDYVSLSDGEHQQAQIMGTMCMLSFPNVLFLLDEPESHFNPLWRVKFISRVLDLPTNHGDRRSDSGASEQECLLTTHSPFVPSDMRRDKVFIFKKREDGKLEYRHPNVETYGTTFDSILEECFGVRRPISKVPLEEIDALMHSSDADEVKTGIDRLGYSVEKIFLIDHLQQLTDK